MSSIKLVTAMPGPKSEALLARREAAVARAPVSTMPVFVARAEGAIVEDVDGNRLLDFAGGIGCVNAGHSPAPVVAAIREQAERFLHTCFVVNPYESYIRLAEILNENTPGSFPKKTFLVNSGAEAVENAVKIARAYTKRAGVICFEDAFHGRTLLGMSLTSKTIPYKAGFGPFAPEIYRIPYAYCYRCAYHLQYPSCGLHCADQLEDAFKRYAEAGAIAAVIFEPVLGEGGFVVPPREFGAKIAEICRRHSILVIADEIQTGFARTGTMFACEQFDIEPDLILTGKSIAAGLPIAAVTGRAEVMDAPMPGGLGGTYSGNPLACEAAIATWEAMTAQQLPARSAQIGRLFEEITRDWSERFPLIGDRRGLGAMRAFELVRDRATKTPAREETARILQHCHDRGLIVISAGTYGNVLRLHLPLVASDEQLREGMAILESAFAATP
ncbi:MAG: 4-aminobutyrate--2-oxoglutarate transaminase [Blastocatellia bacterium]|nr:4-aminobutyrate--2-oxoglutarate transaminase [Blastocatellia bacterium]